MLPEKEILKLLTEFEGEVGLYLEDLTTGECMTVNPDKRFPAASVIKVPLITALFLDAEQGKIDLDQKVVLKPENRILGTGVLKELSPDLNISIRDLATLMIIVSDNAATNEVIDWVGVERLNSLVKELGLTQTIWQRKMLDKEARKAGRDNFTSAGDMGRLLHILVEGKQVSKEVSEQVIDVMKRQQLRNKLPGLLPKKVVIASKTGELTNLVENDVGIFFLPKRTYILAICTKVSSNPIGVKAIAEISRLVYEALREEEE